MQETIYFYISLISAVVAATMAVLLAGMRIRDKEGTRKYNRARWFLSGAFAAYALLSLAELLFSDTAGLKAGGFSGCLVILVGSLMATLVTMTALSFIRPEIVNRKRIIVQLAAILVAGAWLIAVRLQASQTVFKVSFSVMLAAYLLLLLASTRLFVQSYRQFKERMLTFYEESDLVGQLHWINGTFYLALGIGLAALFLLAGNLLLDSILTLLFTVSFLFIYCFFINYWPYAAMVERATGGGKPTHKQLDTNNLDTAELQNKIALWIQQKQFLDNSRSVEDIARQMDWDHALLKKYIQETTGEDFRSWRIRLRIQEAERIMTAQPDLPVSRIATMAGFNDRSYFYRSFQRITGRSVKEYLQSIRKD